MPFASWKEGGRQLPHVPRCFIWPCDAKCRIRMWGSPCRIRTALVGTKEFLGAHDFHRDIAGAHRDANMRRHLMSSKDSLGPHHELNNIQVGNGSSCHQLFLLLFSTSFVCCHLTILYKGRIPWTSFVVSVRSWGCSVSEPRGPLPHEGLWPHGKGDWGAGPMAGPRQKHGGRRGVGPPHGAGAAWPHNLVQRAGRSPQPDGAPGPAHGRGSRQRVATPAAARQ